MFVIKDKSTGKYAQRYENYEGGGYVWTADSMIAHRMAEEEAKALIKTPRFRHKDLEIVKMAYGAR
jgi:hypothetical protein